MSKIIMMKLTSVIGHIEVNSSLVKVTLQKSTFHC